MSTDDGDWGLWQGKHTKLMQVWPRVMTDAMLRKSNTSTEFITYGDKETLEAIQQLNNAHIRAQHGESE